MREVKKLLFVKVPLNKALNPQLILSGSTGQLPGVNTVNNCANVDQGAPGKEGAFTHCKTTLVK